jgi:hypothetical protein
MHIYFVVAFHGRISWQPPIRRRHLCTSQHHRWTCCVLMQTVWYLSRWRLSLSITKITFLSYLIPTNYNPVKRLCKNSTRLSYCKNDNLPVVRWLLCKNTLLDFLEVRTTTSDFNATQISLILFHSKQIFHFYLVHLSMELTIIITQYNVPLKNKTSMFCQVYILVLYVYSCLVIYNILVSACSQVIVFCVVLYVHSCLVI